MVDGSANGEAPPSTHVQRRLTARSRSHVRDVCVHVESNAATSAAARSLLICRVRALGSSRSAQKSFRHDVEDRRRPCTPRGGRRLQGAGDSAQDFPGSGLKRTPEC